jgi:hypothetical protein
MLEAIVAGVTEKDQPELMKASSPLTLFGGNARHLVASKPAESSKKAAWNSKRRFPMTKRIGVLSLILAAGMAVLQPAAALAQDRNYRDRGYREQPRHEERFRQQERRDFRGPEVRGREWREPYVERSYRERGYGYVYSAPRYDGYYYQPVRPYCR